MTTKNIKKGDSFTYAYARINESINDGFFLEAVTLAESIISDRLYSFVKHHEANSENASKSSTKEKKANKRTSLQNLIVKARRIKTLQIKTKSGADMFDAVDDWRVQRNQCVHSVAKSEPGTATMSVEEFVAMAKEAALKGKELARLICNWHRDIKNSN